MTQEIQKNSVNSEKNITPPSERDLKCPLVNTSTTNYQLVLAKVIKHSAYFISYHSQVLISLVLLLVTFSIPYTKNTILLRCFPENNDFKSVNSVCTATHRLCLPCFSISSKMFNFINII